MTRVLYVDDEPDIREIAELSLSLDPGFDVRTAASGEEALALVAEWQPDVILLDVMMPVMDGPAVLARLREREVRTPVVFVTARAQRSEMQSFATLDAKGVLAKPFDPVTLAAQVRALL
ncbi:MULTISPECIES: response regulator [Bacteria]|uniref:response regulator n=1 Tax=Bacteria TaxID=2 RepID=UPI001038787E|nr:MULTISPECIES: response regulator [Bacteria]QDM40609.1 response regulator [Altererythrobacter sp. TH136]TCJ38840.1 response regulator [Parafrankia sp. BMG5.11]